MTTFSSTLTYQDGATDNVVVTLGDHHPSVEGDPHHVSIERTPLTPEHRLYRFPDEKRDCDTITFHSPQDYRAAVSNLLLAGQCAGWGLPAVVETITPGPHLAALSDTCYELADAYAAAAHELHDLAQVR